MSPLRLTGSTSGYSEIDAPAVAGDQTFTLPGTGGTIVTTAGTQTLTNKTIQGGAITSGTSVASTSGTAIDFTGIPSWVKRITLMLAEVSTNGTSEFRFQLGTSSGLATTGYTNTASYIAVTNNTTDSKLNTTDGFYTYGGTQTTMVASSLLTFVNVSGNIWLMSGSFVPNDATSQNTYFITGNVTLSGVLDRVRVTTASSDTFDAGTINILYEG